MPDRFDLYDALTSQVISALEAGTPPWRKPWTAGGGFLPLRHEGTPYRGVNILLLWMQAEARGYTRPQWMSFRQANEYGGHVRKGEKGTGIVYCEPIHKKETAPDGSETESHFWITKSYIVFNVEQCDGLPDRFQAPTPTLDAAQRIEHAEAFFKNVPARIEHGGDRASYRPLSDDIRMPEFGWFKTPEAYYATLGHECVHWTGHASRLNRPFGRPGSEAYGREELIAELGACFLAAHLGIEPVTRDDHAAYLSGWLQILREDNRAIFTAAAQAQRGVDLLIGPSAE